MTSEVSSMFERVGNIVKLIETQPVSVTLVLALMVVGWLLKRGTAWIEPRKRRQAVRHSFIPLTLSVIGFFSNQRLIDPVKVHYSVSDPAFLVGMTGVLFAFASIAIHAIVIKPLARKFFPDLENDPEDSQQNDKTT